MGKLRKEKGASAAKYIPSFLDRECVKMAVLVWNIKQENILFISVQGGRHFSEEPLLYEEERMLCVTYPSIQ